MAERVRITGTARPQPAAEDRAPRPSRGPSARRKPDIDVVVRVCRPQNRLDSGRAASNTPAMVDPLVAALAQLVRDRWAVERRERAARRATLKLVEGRK